IFHNKTLIHGQMKDFAEEEI
ncbi:MAG: ABC transporter ATP-binding protein, partial [Lactobacillus iners]|nr:ABC transporter ATP-binding protein [Lactobacillus iners]